MSELALVLTRSTEDRHRLPSRVSLPHSCLHTCFTVRRWAAAEGKRLPAQLGGPLAAHAQAYSYQPQAATAPYEPYLCVLCFSEWPKSALNLHRIRV